MFISFKFEIINTSLPTHLYIYTTFFGCYLTNIYLNLFGNIYFFHFCFCIIHSKLLIWNLQLYEHTCMCTYNIYILFLFHKNIENEIKNFTFSCSHKIFLSTLRSYCIDQGSGNIIQKFLDSFFFNVNKKEKKYKHILVRTSHNIYKYITTITL